MYNYSNMIDTRPMPSTLKAVYATYKYFNVIHTPVLLIKYETGSGMCALLCTDVYHGEQNNVYSNTDLQIGT